MTGASRSLVLMVSIQMQLPRGAHHGSKTQFKFRVEGWGRRQPSRVCVLSTGEHGQVESAGSE